MHLARQQTHYSFRASFWFPVQNQASKSIDKCDIKLMQQNGIISRKCKKLKMIRNRFFIFSLHSPGLALYREFRSFFHLKEISSESGLRHHECRDRRDDTNRHRAKLMCGDSVTFIFQTSIKWSAVLNLILWGQLRRPLWWCCLSIWCRLDVDLVVSVVLMLDDGFDDLSRIIS